MKSALVIAAALAGTLAFAPAAEAGSWKRSSTTVGPYGGVWNSNGGGSCAGGVCNWSGTTVGPGGGVYTRSGQAVRTAPGQWQVNSQATGPRGGTVTRSSNWQFAR